MLIIGNEQNSKIFDADFHTSTWKLQLACLKLVVMVTNIFLHAVGNFVF